MEEEKQKDVTYFGRTNFRNAQRLFGIKRMDRRQHMYVIGKSGTGKTTLIKNLAIQDIKNGEGVCIVDPHGEYVEELLKKIPEDRINDIVYFNPADPDYFIGFNILELPDPQYKHLIASGLMAVFTKIWANAWSSRMEYILNNAVLALLDTPGTTLLGITRILVDKEYRKEIVGNIKDPVVKAFWINEYEEWREQFRNEAIAPIQNKVGQFLSTPLIRNIVGQSKSTINIFDIMNEGKILLVNVSKGRIGEDNSALLGAMIITKLQLAAMERIKIPEEDRVDFYLYVDEFQNFATDSFASILSEARKYRLNLVIAHQYIGQLVTDTSTKVRDAIFGNAGTIIAFRVGAGDAEFLEKEFGPDFELQDLVNLPNRTIILKLVVNGVSSRPFSAGTLPPFDIQTIEDIERKIIEASRKRYARPRWIIEEEINKWSGTAFSKPGYMITCSLCGKETTVPFQPEEGRPVYCQSCILKVRANMTKPEGGATKVEIIKEAPKQDLQTQEEKREEQQNKKEEKPINIERNHEKQFVEREPQKRVFEKEKNITPHEQKEEKLDILDALDKVFLGDIPNEEKKESVQNIRTEVDAHIRNQETKHIEYKGFTKNYKEKKQKQEPNRDDLKSAIEEALRKE